MSGSWRLQRLGSTPPVFHSTRAAAHSKYVTVEFDSEMDYWRARQLVSERLAQVLPQLPVGTKAPLVSSLTNRLNEVYEYLVEGDVEPMVLRDVAEFDLRYRILAVPGVASVERLGGRMRQFQVQLDPGRMQALGVGLDQVCRRSEKAMRTLPAASCPLAPPSSRFGAWVAFARSTICVGPWSWSARTRPSRWAMSLVSSRDRRFSADWRTPPAAMW